MPFLIMALINLLLLSKYDMPDGEETGRKHEFNDEL